MISATESQGLTTEKHGESLKRQAIGGEHPCLSAVQCNFCEGSVVKLPFGIHHTMREPITY